MRQIELILSRHGETEEAFLLMLWPAPRPSVGTGQTAGQSISRNAGQGGVGRDRVQRPRT